MKRFFCFALAMFTVFVIPLALFGQEPLPPPGDPVVLPDIPLTFDFKQYVVSFLYYAATVVALTALINRFITGLKGFAKQYLSWFVAVLVGLAAFLANLGIFENMSWWQTLLYAIITGFGANGVFDWQLVQAILRGIKLEPSPTPAIVQKE